eukprot:4899846-Pleurochrysis_carterae.AAC.1
MRKEAPRRQRGNGVRVPTLTLAPPPPRPLGRGRSRLGPRRWFPRQHPSLSVPMPGSTGPCRPRRKPPARAVAGGPAGAREPVPCRAVSAPRPLAHPCARVGCASRRPTDPPLRAVGVRRPRPHPRARPRVSRRGVRGGGW